MERKWTIREEANAITVRAFRNGYIEELHAGKASELLGQPGYSQITVRFRSIAIHRKSPRSHGSQGEESTEGTTSVLLMKSGCKGEREIRRRAKNLKTVPEEAVNLQIQFPTSYAKRAKLTGFMAFARGLTDCASFTLA